MSDQLTREEALHNARMAAENAFNRPADESVAHVESCPLRFMEAAEHHRSNGDLDAALHCASMAEGLALGLWEVAKGANWRGGRGAHEAEVHRRAAALCTELRCALAGELMRLRGEL